MAALRSCLPLGWFELMDYVQPREKSRTSNARPLSPVPRLWSACPIGLFPELVAFTVVVRMTRCWRSIETEDRMDWNRVEGNWKQVKGKVKEKWGQLTEDDLDTVNGRRDQLEGKIQQRYGLAKDMVRKDVDDWLKMQH